MPVRIQRKRSKGYKMPPGAIYVGRNTRWGNPYRVTARQSPEDVVTLYRIYLRGLPAQKLRDMLEPLRGHDLACWCGEGEPCHADELLRLCAELDTS